MRGVVRFIIMVFALGFASAQAAGPDGFRQIYAAPTKANMGGRPVVADIELYARELSGGRVAVALVTDVTKFIRETESDLENWIATHQDECGERWGAGEPLIGFPENAIRFALSLEYELWNCGWNGKGKPGRIVRETGSVDVTLIPEIIDGKLQARLGDFSLEERSGVNKYLPLEYVARRVLENELVKLNDNPKFFRPPQPFHREGFVYEAISAEQANDRVVITAWYVADRKKDTLKNLIDGLNEDGIISER